jgi:type I restriction enzyme S subunit
VGESEALPRCGAESGGRGQAHRQWRKEHPDVEPASRLLEHILVERRRKWEEGQRAKFAAAGKEPPKGWKDRYTEPVRPNMGELYELPNGWVWATLDALAMIAGGLTKGQKRKPSEKTRDVPYLRVANVQRGYLDLTEVKTIAATEDEIEELGLQVGDVLFNEGGDRDKLGRGWVWDGEIPECVHQNHVFRARTVHDDIQSKFVSVHGNTFGRLWFQKHGKQSVNLASINMTVLRQFPIPLPPAKEQDEIVKEVEDQLSVIDKAAVELGAGLRRARRLRQSILKRAFEGKLVPQDPSDEPASVLLERIRAARAKDTAQPARKGRKVKA